MRPELHESWIDSKALEIVERLQNRKFEAYLVGGCVRDLLVNVKPKDFDIATSAQPEEVRKIIPHSYLIGRRFKLILVRRGQSQYEISTFRRNRGPEEEVETDLPVDGDNLFGTVEEDASRRDFTVNAIFYDPTKKNLIDYCQGLPDIESRLIRVIGDPEKRIHEDSIRILRGIRLAHKLSFNIDDSFRQAISLNAHSLKLAILPRKREEFIKILRLYDPGLVFMDMFDLNLLEPLLPSLMPLFENETSRLSFLDILFDLKESLPWAFEPGDLFLILLYAFIKSDPELKDLNADRLESNEKLNRFMKDELGIFKQESIQFFKTLEVMEHLLKPDIFIRKGERRKKAFLSHPQLRLANELCLYEKMYKFSDYYFWNEQIQLAISTSNR